MYRQNTATPFSWLEEAKLAPGRWALAVAGLVLGAVLGATVMAAASHGQDAGERPAELRIAAREWPTRPLPKEWRWQPRTVKYQHMFRHGR